MDDAPGYFSDAGCCLEIAGRPAGSEPGVPRSGGLGAVLRLMYAAKGARPGELVVSVMLSTAGGHARPSSALTIASSTLVRCSIARHSGTEVRFSMNLVVGSLSN